MRIFITLSILMVSVKCMAQHCPWDCAGMIVLQIDVPKKIEHLGLTLVDENRREITDTIYGTGKDTYDECVFLSYDSFTKRRTEKINLHHWYRYDTIYKFAKGNYIVKYNYCKYRERKLYIRYVDQYMRSLVYHYIEIPIDKRIHLHDYSDELHDGKVEEMREKTKNNVIVLTCGNFLYRNEDCK
jgi:hypothetical protein